MYSTRSLNANHLIGIFNAEVFLKTARIHGPKLSIVTL
jgi:hypothetical protein